jgi:hypothetical protein
MKNIDNYEEAKPDTELNGSPKPDDLPSPKRGAFPTPKNEIERAKPYIPEPEQECGQKPTEPDSPTSDDAGAN